MTVRAYQRRTHLSALTDTDEEGGLRFDTSGKTNVANSGALNCTGMAVNPRLITGEGGTLVIVLPLGRLLVLLAQPLLFTHLSPLRKLATSSLIKN